MKKHFSLILKAVLSTALFATVLSTSFAQTIQNVKDINTTGTTNSYPFDFTIVNNKLFFIAANNSNTYGLWITEGTNATTQMLSTTTGPLNNIADIIGYNGKVYFSYNDGVNGYELWVSDGTVAGTMLFKDINAGSTGSFPKAFKVANNKLFFMTDINRKLYATDGTAAGTVIVKNNAVDLFNGIADFAILNNYIYFISDNGTGSGYGMWKSDGSAGGAALVKPDLISTGGNNYVVLNNKLFFSGSDDTNGSELWVSDGTDVGTHIVINLSADVGGVLTSGAPKNLIVYKNKIYFTGRDDLHGTELFVTDGTAAGTQIVKDMEPGTAGSVPTKSIEYNGNLYFSCYAGVAAGFWKSDGTEAGTVLVKSGGGTEPFLNDIKLTAVWNGKIYFVVNDGQYYPVWQSDGTAPGTKPIQLQNTVNPVSSLNGDFKVAEYNTELYLSASCIGISSGYEPCKLTAGVALPLQLLSFTGEVQGDKDVLKWTTANEINTAHFIIEQSVDGRIYKPIIMIPAKGNYVGITTYNYSQLSVLNTGGFYRLQIVDRDGKSNYSPVVKLLRKNNSSISAIYNAANRQIIIKNNTQANCNWSLIAANGSTIKQGASGDATITIPVSGIAACTYVIFCKILNDVMPVKLVIF